MLHAISNVKHVSLTGSWYTANIFTRMGYRTLIKNHGSQGSSMGWILGYKGKCWWLCGVIDHAEQHILSTECLGYGFVVIVWVSAFDILRWVGGLAKNGVLGHVWDGYSVSCITVGGFVGLSTMMNNISKDGSVGVMES